MKKKIRLLIIDEHPAVCEALEVRLRSNPAIEIIGVANTALRAIANDYARRPDVVLLGLKRRNSREPHHTYEMVQQLVKWGTAVIVLTSYSDDGERERLLRAGAKRYLLKDINTPQLLAEIEAIVVETAESYPLAHPTSAMTSISLEGLH